MPTNQIIWAALIVVLIAAVFVRFVRGIVLLFVRLTIFVVATGVAALGISLLMNNETIYQQPGVKARTLRFFTMNSAATSAKGLGSATCDWTGLSAHKAEEPAAAPSEARKRRRERTAATGAEPPAPTAMASPAATTAEEEEIYPELIRRGFPGIARQKLFELSQQTVNSLGGWKIVESDPRSYTLRCLYSTRIFGWQDDIRIVVAPSSEIDLCSRSEIGLPESTSWLRLFPGDLGANAGHIKQFYEALESRMDEVYKQEQEKENAKKPH